MRINWSSSETLTILNPKLPKALHAAVEKYSKPQLLAHIWLTSSGTTSDGEIKLVALSKRAFLASAQAVNTHLQATPRDVWLNTLPHFHVGGLGIFCRAHLLKNKVVDMSDKPWDPRQFLKTLQDIKVTLTSLVPTQVYDLCRLGIRCPEHVRAIVVGGAQLSTEIYTQARQLGYPLLPSFGMTEFASQVATADLSSLAEKKNNNFPDLKVLPHCEVRADDGLLEIRGPALCSFVACLGNDQVISEAMIGEGRWFKTPDRVQLGKGTLSPLGRAGDFIKVSGELVNVAELRQLLINTLDLMQMASMQKSCTLLAREDSRRGFTLTMVMQKKLWLRGDEIVRRWNAQVLPVARIREVYYVNDIPVVALGKIAHKQLEKILFS